MSKQIKDILAARQKTHGDFNQNAFISQALKEVLWSHCELGKLSPVHREALEMICFKMSRIIAGNDNCRDHWDDIAGYATLAAEACDKERGKK